LRECYYGFRFVGKYCRATVLQSYLS
jgi:hypothetical protein